MFRWKIFLPLALAVSLLALAGNHFWVASVDNRGLNSLIGEDIEDVSREEDTVFLVLSADSDMFQALSFIDEQGGADLFAGRVLQLSRAERNPVPDELANEIELLVAQTAATRQYYEAAAELATLAETWGYKAHVIVWNRYLMVEVDNGREAFYLTRRLPEEGAAT